MTITKGVKMYHIKCPLNKYTFKSTPVRIIVEKLAEGRTLNLFAGKTKLNIDEVRNDLDPTMNAEYHLDAYDFVTQYKGEPFNTVLLDPAYSIRKSIELYHGNKMSKFNAIKNTLSALLTDRGLVITFGYHSISMGATRGFQLERVIILCHGGATHDTIISVERKQ
jgi:hypothetical protein